MALILTPRVMRWIAGKYTDVVDIASDAVGAMTQSNKSKSGSGARSALVFRGTSGTIEMGLRVRIRFPPAVSQAKFATRRCLPSGPRVDAHRTRLAGGGSATERVMRVSFRINGDPSRSRSNHARTSPIAGATCFAR